MRLADFIDDNIEAILAEWENFARGLAPGSVMDVIGLRDHAEAILRARPATWSLLRLRKSNRTRVKGLAVEESRATVSITLLSSTPSGGSGRDST